MLVTFGFNKILKKRIKFNYNRPLKYFLQNFYTNHHLINTFTSNGLPRIKRKLLVKFL